MPGVSPPCRYDQQVLSLDFLELLLRFLPTEYERTLIGKFERDQQPPEELSEEDQFMIRFSKIPRLAERMNVMIFLGSFGDTAQLLMPVCAGDGWGGAARGRLLRRHSHPSLPPTATQRHHRRLHVPQVLQQTAPHPRGEGFGVRWPRWVCTQCWQGVCRHCALLALCPQAVVSLQIVLAFGNYMNSSKRGAAYGFRLQSLDAVWSAWGAWCGGGRGHCHCQGPALGTEGHKDQL